LKYHQLTHEERYAIAGGLRIGRTGRSLAGDLGRSPSTVTREIRRNATAHDGAYRREKAQSYAVAKRRRSRRGSQFDEAVLQQVRLHIRERLSPVQIVGKFTDEGMPVPSHETIYRLIRQDKRDGGTLYRYTRIMAKTRRKRYRSPRTRGVLPGKKHISEREPIVDQRGRIGDWEGDTVMGRTGSPHCLLTLVERKSGYAVIRKLAARTMAEATAAVADVIKPSQHMFHTITFDNGTEFYDYKKLEDRFEVKCYFATPYHSWERGSNENLNGLVRQYLPKGRCLRSVTQADCDQIANALNNRPRKRHGFKTPNTIFLGLGA
jgi:transposase, IS30 family